MVNGRPKMHNIKVHVGDN